MLFLGIDGGGTKTTAMLGDGSRVLAEASGGPLNLNRVAADTARATLAQLVADVCASSGMSAGEIASVCIGAAGTGDPANRATMLELVRAAVPGAHVEVAGDHEIALTAAFGSGAGVIVIAGTGSIALGRNASGQQARAGGWGPLVSDEGSAHWIGRECVRAALRALDAGQGTQALPAILKHWGVKTHAEAVKLVNSVPPPRFADLFPVVADFADARDTLATTALQRAGEELALLAAAVTKRLWRPEEPVQVAIAGGVFKRAQIVREVFAASLPEGATLVPLVVEPALGALAMARAANQVER